MVGVAGKHIGAHAKQADRAVLSFARQRFRALGDPAWHARVVDTDFRIGNGGSNLKRPAQMLSCAIGVAIDQRPDHVGDVFVGSRQPVLQGQEIGAHVLGGAGDEAQDLRNALQHLHLL